MRIRVEGREVLTAADHLVVRGVVARSGLELCGRAPEGLCEPALRDGANAVADVAADVLELLAQDLALLATKVVAGALRYDDVEHAIERAAVRGRPR